MLTISNKIAYLISYLLSCDGNTSTYNDTNSYNFSHAQNLTTWCRDPHTCAQWKYEDPDSFVAEVK